MSDAAVGALASKRKEQLIARAVRMR